jgi:hypothetical protein
MNLKEIFEYDNIKGLYFKHNPNKSIGTIDNNGYTRLMYKYKRYMLHRLVYEYHFGKINDNLIIDHIDGNKQNNLIENLRVATYAQNQMNRKTNLNNKLKIKGVYYHKQHNKYHARIQINNSKKHLGYFDSLEEASQAYQTAAKELFGEFYKV